MKARFNNQDDALFPNQFVNARMLVDTEQNAVVIPTAALQMGNEGHFVWVLNSENKVSKHLVTPGIQDSQKVVIRAGISAGDRVVTDGIDRLTEGAKVEVVEAQSATTPEEKATSREYAKKELAPDASVTPSSTGGPSRLFIMRPVATTLLMVAILLAGIIGYRALPVSALPEVDYPTIQVVTLYQCEPGCHDLCRYRAARTPVRADVWPETDVVAKFRRCVSYHFTVPANITAGCRRAGSAGRD